MGDLYFYILRWIDEIGDMQVIFGDKDSIWKVMDLIDKSKLKTKWMSLRDSDGVEHKPFVKIEK